MAKPATLVSIMSANNETGVLQPIDRGSRRSAEPAGVPLHVDATQSVGKLPVHLDTLGASRGHVHRSQIPRPSRRRGSLARRRSEAPPDVPRWRATTGNASRNRTGRPGAAAWPRRFDWRPTSLHGSRRKMRELRDRLEKNCCAARRTRDSGTAVKPRLPGTTCISFPGYRSPVDADGARYGRNRMQQRIGLQQRQQPSESCAVWRWNDRRASSSRPCVWCVEVFHRR